MIALAKFCLYITWACSGLVVVQTRELKIDAKQPYVYVTFYRDDIGNKNPSGKSEPLYWLRLVNNSHELISVHATHWYPGDSLDHRVVSNLRCMTGVVTESTTFEAKCRVGDEVRYQDQPEGWFPEQGHFQRILRPGTDIFFPVPQTHVNERWHIEIPFVLGDDETAGASYPRSTVAFTQEQLPANVRSRATR